MPKCYSHKYTSRIIQSTRFSRVIITCLSYKYRKRCRSQIFKIEVDTPELNSLSFSLGKMRCQVRSSIPCPCQLQLEYAPQTLNQENTKFPFLLSFRVYYWFYCAVLLWLKYLPLSGLAILLVLEEPTSLSRSSQASGASVTALSITCPEFCARCNSWEIALG